MQNVLLLGDSIRLFYQDKVKEKLGDGYMVQSPAENCRFSYFVLNSLRLWLPGFETPDIIHWNAGLWDTAILYPEDGCFISKNEYVANMKKILRELKKTGAKIIFATTTAVSDSKKELPGPMPPRHLNEDIIEYNKAVLEAFKDEDIDINDLHSVMYAHREELLLDDMIHPNEKGVEILSDEVVKCIRKYVNFKNSQSISVDMAYVEKDEKTIQ